MTQVKRTITELIPLDEARKLIGAEVQGVCHGSLHNRGVVAHVDVDPEGDLRFNLRCASGCVDAWIAPRVGWSLAILQEAPSPKNLDRLHAERARIDEEIAAAEKAQESEGLPEGFRWCDDGGRVGVKGSIYGQTFSTGFSFDPHDWVWIRRDFCGRIYGSHLPFDVMAAIVDRVRSEGGLT